jgi:uncharacterized protein (TIGR03067 family)
MRSVLPLLAVLLVGFAPAPFPKGKSDNRTDLEKMEGTWELHTRVVDGKAGKPSRVRWVISGPSLTIHDGSATYRWRLVLGTKAKPRAMDMHRERGENPMPWGDELRAVYAVDGDTLTVCYDLNNWLARPRDLLGQSRSRVVDFFKRRKP